MPRRRKTTALAIERLELRVVLTSAISGTWGWVDAVAALANDATTDAQGNVYVVGGFSGSVYNGDLDFDPGPGQSLIHPRNGTDPAYGDAFIAKYDTSGAFQWVRALSVPWGKAGLTHIEVATDGTLRLLGSAFNQHAWQSAALYVSAPTSEYQDLATIDPGRTESFACSFTAAGSFQWLTLLPRAIHQTVSASSLDLTTNTLFIGYDNQQFYRVATDGTLNTSPLPFRQLSSLGGTAGRVAVDRSSADPNGNLYLAGHFSGGVDFDSSDAEANLYSTFRWDWDTFHNYLIRHWSQDLFIAKYDSLGNLLWVKAQGEAGLQEEVNSLAVSSDGSLAITGSRISSAGFTASYSSDGVLRWTKDIRADVDIGTVIGFAFNESNDPLLITTNGLLTTDPSTGGPGDWIAQIYEGNLCGASLDDLGRFVAWSTGPIQNGRQLPRPRMDVSGDFPLVMATYNSGGGYPGTYFAAINLLNMTPVDVSLSATQVTENLPSASTVGLLSATDPDVGDSITFSGPSGIFMGEAVTRRSRSR